MGKEQRIIRLTNISRRGLRAEGTDVSSDLDVSLLREDVGREPSACALDPLHQRRSAKRSATTYPRRGSNRYNGKRSGRRAQRRRCDLRNQFINDRARSPALGRLQEGRT